MLISCEKSSLVSQESIFNLSRCEKVNFSHKIVFFRFFDLLLLCFCKMHLFLLLWKNILRIFSIFRTKIDTWRDKRRFLLGTRTILNRFIWSHSGSFRTFLVLIESFIHEDYFLCSKFFNPVDIFEENQEQS